MTGILVIDKPAGMTSRRAVDAVKLLIPKGTKVGHAGTLDSFATGVLLILVGSATKSCEKLMDQPKTYEATVKFGATTETDDPTSEEVPFLRETHDSSRGCITRKEIESALLQFTGAIQQRPPNFSALKVGGRRASDRTRAGETLDLAPRAVNIYKIELLDFDFPNLQLRIDCGRGTYIRSLARDLGEALQVGGYLTQLRRTRVGEFTLDQSISLDQLNLAVISANLRPI